MQHENVALILQHEYVIISAKYEKCLFYLYLQKFVNQNIYSTLIATFYIHVLDRLFFIGVQWLTSNISYKLSTDSLISQNQIIFTIGTNC